MSNPKICCLGYGYSASFVIKKLMNFDVLATCRSEAKRVQLQKESIEAYCMDEHHVLNPAILQNVTHVLISIPPAESGDWVIQQYEKILCELPDLEWVGYVSTTGVYGDKQGAWVDETTTPTPPPGRLQRRLEAENAWLSSGLPVHIFRLSGIYGKGRSAIDKLREGTARRIDKPGQVFSRIHVEDIAQIIAASIENPDNGAIYNLADDVPEAQEKVIAYAASLLKISPPPLISFEKADLSPVARSFYANNRRVSNDKIKQNLNITLAYPSYKDGLIACL